MRIVLDTNVLVAGLLSPFGPCGQIVRMISTDKITLCADARILSEYAEVLRRPKFRFDGEMIETLLEFMASRCQIVASCPIAGTLPDRDDEPFVEVALAGNADCLVTGNQSHFPAGPCKGVRILSPSEFLKYYTRSQGGRDRS